VHTEEASVTPSGRRFEVVVVDWDAAVADGPLEDADALTRVVDDLTAYGLDVAVTTAGPTAKVDARLGARPAGPGELLLCGESGADVVCVDASGVRAVDGAGPGDVMAWLVDRYWRRGVAPAAVLVLAAPASEVLAALTDQCHRRVRAEPPANDAPPLWRVDVDGYDPEFEPVHETLLTLADGRLGTRGSPLVGRAAADPTVLYSGAYRSTGPATELAPLPHWARLATDVECPPPRRRTLDLRAGLLFEDGPVLSVRLSSLDQPGTVAVRLTGDPDLLPAEGTTVSDATGTRLTAAWTDRRRGDGVDRVGAYHPGRAAATAALRRAESAGFDRLLRAHREAWARRWAAADIEVDGDDDLQQAVRFTLFHLMGSVADEGEVGLGARGLSGPAYRGHVFWDSDVFVLPFLAATHPAAARAMLEYRVRRLDAARELARRYGRAGARFPWESAERGDDVTPTSMHLPNGELLRIRTGEQEEHIVADVAWAAVRYVEWTGDTAFAAGPGRDLLVGTARYWASRARLDPGGRAHIYGVVGPDEYHQPVDDNAFTNVMARWNLRRAAELEGVPADERDSWRSIADALVDGYDPTSRLYEQFAGFYGLEPIMIADISPRRPIAADLLLGTGRTRRAQVLKQMDVLMLHHLVPEEVQPDSLQPNLDYYEPRTAHGSSLSPAVQASLLARAGRPEEALRWLHLAARLDLDDVTGSTAGGLHVATMGGLWQALVFGFAGVRAERGRLVVDPRLPASWRALRLNLRFHDRLLRMTVTPTDVRIRSDGLELRSVADHWEVVRR
jgi:trehalose/maltose hydrolase-like predicted phosphorylase